MKIFSLDNDNKYSIISRPFHWLRFLLLSTIYLCAYTKIMDHRMFGITMFVFIIFNIVWRFFNKTPNSFAGSNLESNVEKLVHISMYVLLVSLPILGYSASMSDVNILGINIPNIYSIDLFSKIYLNQHLNMDIFAFRSFIGGIHKFLTIILLLLVSLHVFVIAFNRIVKKTGELKRMI